MSTTKEYADGLVLDYDECLDYCMKETGLEREIVEKVLDAETNFMVKVGIATIEE